MSLTNNLITGNLVTSSYPTRIYKVTIDDIVALGAYTTGIVVLDTLPAGWVLLADRIKHVTAVGGGGITASTARLSFNGTALGAGALDVYAAVGTTDGTHSITGVTPIAGDAEATSTLIMTITSTTSNLSAATAGEIHAWAYFIPVGGE